MRCRSFLCVLFMSVLMLGCGSSGPNFAPGAGTILLDGKPFPKVSVTFVPKDGPSSVGVADDSGKFQLYGPGSKRGILPGDYVVIVECPYDPNMGSSSDGSAPVASESAGCVVPVKYAMSSTSDLQVTIPPEGDEAIVLQLVSE